MNEFQVQDTSMLSKERINAIRTWEASFHENIMALGKDYNQSRVRGGKRFSVAIKSSFVFFAKLADAQLSKLSKSALQLMMREGEDIPVEINRNQAARAKCNAYSINTIKNHIDAMVDIGMVTDYTSYYLKGHKRIYRLRLSKEWLSIALGANMSRLRGENAIPSASPDKSQPSPSEEQKDGNGQKNEDADYQRFNVSEIQSLTTIYNRKNISNRYHSKSSGEDKSSTMKNDKSVAGFGNLKKNDEGTNEKNRPGQNFKSEKNKFSGLKSGSKNDLILKPSQSLILDSKRLLKLRFARNLWQQCRSTIFSSMSFGPIQDEQYSRQLLLHMDNMELESNWSKLFDRKPEIIEIYNTLGQAITLAASFQNRTEKSGEKFVFWLSMFLDMEIDLMNGELKNKKYLSLQRWTYDFLPKTWEKNREKLERGTMKWQEQRIRLYINQVFENMLNFAIKHEYTQEELKDKKWKNRNYVIRKLKNSILTKDTKRHLLELYDLRVRELENI